MAEGAGLDFEKVSSIKKLAHSNADCGLLIAEFKTFEKKYLSVRNAECGIRSQLKAESSRLC
jgi:hypothetical protein